MTKPSISQVIGDIENYRWLRLIGIPVWIFLFLAGFIGFPGSKFIYLLFSITFNLLLFSGFFRQKNYSYLYLVVFLWLGFWFKLGANFLLFGGYFYGEPVGNFNNSPAAWDDVACISIVAAFGVMGARLGYGMLKTRSTLFFDDTAKAPSWFPALRNWIWPLLMLFALGLAVVNVIYGIQQVGLAPRTIFPWPLNAGIAWVVSIGSAIGIATLLHWDLALRKNIGTPVYAVLLEACFSTLSLLSRAVYPFHVLPQMIALSKNRSSVTGFSKRKAILFVMIFFLFFTVSIVTVSKLRDYHYAAQSLSEPARPAALSESAESIAKLPPEIPSLRLILLHQLLVNRWIGLEGVMAVSSYPVKNLDLLWEMMKEKREIGKTTLYQKISNSDYQATDSKYQFASLPGATAFFSYSGSLLITLTGVAGLTLCILFLESVIFSLTRNPLVCSLFGLTLANTVAQFGVTPRQDMPYFFMIISAAIFIHFLQSRRFESILLRVSPGLFNRT